MSFAQPFLLVGLLVVAVAVGVWFWLRGRPARYAVRFTNVEVLATVAEGGRRWRRLPGLLFVLALCSASVALARPYQRVLVPFERASVILVIDVSTSMGAKDIRPSRLGAAQEAARAFLTRLPRRLRVGVIAFSSEPAVAAPPTSDHRLVREAIDGLSPGGATAIGDALAAALRLGRRAVAAASGNRSPGLSAGVGGLVSIVLLSDGRQDAGRLQPLQAARQARQAGVRIYAIALGAARALLTSGDTGSSFIAPPDIGTLRATATMTGGQFSDATDATLLRGAYTRLGRRLGWKTGREEISFLFVAASAALLISASVLGTLWSPRLP